MCKPGYASLLAFVLLLALVSPARAGTVTVVFDPGTTNETTALTGFGTTGNLMAGMNVTAFFSDSTAETVVWASLGFPAGKATGTGWFLSESGDTFNSNWILSNSTGKSMTRVLIDAGPGDSVFDTRKLGDIFGTPGSFRGLNFTVIAGLGSLDILACYRDEVAITGNAPVGDLYRFLDIEFTNAGGFPSSGSTLVFRADTDNLLFAGDINAPPECDADGPYTVECAGSTTNVALDGSGSSDADDDPLDFLWTTDCPNGSFDDDTSETPTLTIDSVAPCPLVCNVSLTVDDGLATDSCSTTVTIDDTTDPAIECPTDFASEPPQLNCQVTFNVNATALDVCDADPVIESVPALPATFDRIGDHEIDFEATDACGNSSGCTMTVTVLPTAYCLKAEAIDALEALLGVDSGDNDLIDAIGFLHMSLGEDDAQAGMSGSEVTWGDPNHVDTCNGGFKGADAFQFEQQACDKLDAYVENNENDGFGFGAAIDAVRESLAEADGILAATAIADAIAEVGNPDDIAVAQQLKAEGDAAAAVGGTQICDVALDKYEEAWEKAVKSWCGSE